jgi:hypothetical protein
VYALLFAAAPVAEASSVWFVGAVTQARHIRPRTLWLSADGSLEVMHIRWSRWGEKVAVGRGRATWHSCTPTCWQATVHHAKVTVHLWDVVGCGGQLYYNKVTLYRRRGKVPVWYQHWAPCS